MKKLLRAGATFAALIAGRALAADLAAPIRAVPELPIGWSGFYVGANIGGTLSSTNSVTVTTVAGTTFDAGGPILLQDAFPAAASESAVLGAPRRAALMGGGQIGYNWQVASFVAGLEGDIQGLVGSESSAANLTFVGPLSASTGAPFVTTFNVSRRIDYLGTVRGRLGYLASPGLLVYGTGGLAYAGITESIGFTTSNGGYGAANGVTSSWFIKNDFATARAGGTVGGGLEWMFAPNLTLKAEYLYYNLGTYTATIGRSGPVILAGFPGAGSYFFANISTVSARYSGNIMRVGLNYKFGAFPAFPRF
jgi:outer membrane immunogenic protein